MKRFATKVLMAVTFKIFKIIDTLNKSSVSAEADIKERTSGRAAIVITTFSGRFLDFTLPTLRWLREAGVEREIFLVINGDQQGGFNVEARTNFITAALKEINVNPLCFGQGRGMSELWNLGARAAGTEKLIFLSDDLIINPRSSLAAIEAVEHALETSPLVILNESFGHFGTTRTALSRVGWFDERFLGFGEEDGDFYWRIRNSYPDRKIQWISSPGIHNISSETGFEEIKSNDTNKYSVFNRAFLNVKYEFDQNDPKKGFEATPKLRLEVDFRYADESFRDKYGHLLNEANYDTVLGELLADVQGRDDRA